MEACIEFVLQIVSVMFTKEQVEGAGVLPKFILISVATTLFHSPYQYLPPTEKQTVTPRSG